MSGLSEVLLTNLNSVDMLMNNFTWILTFRRRLHRMRFGQVWHDII